MKKRIRFAVILLSIVILWLIFLLCIVNTNTEIMTIKSEKQLLKICKGDISDVKEIATTILTMPFSVIYEASYGISSKGDFMNSEMAINSSMVSIDKADATSASSSKKDYSKTNIQVKNVDEADITKTDGDYIYSISNNKVIITDVNVPNDIKICAEIEMQSDSVPDDLVLYNDKLVVISANYEGTSISSIYSNNFDTVVEVYAITVKKL